MEATPITAATAASIAGIALQPDLTPGGLADLLTMMPDDVAGLTRRDVQTGADSATGIFLAGEESGQPEYGLIVALVVEPRDDADAVVAELERTRWGDPSLHTVTSSSPGDDQRPAFREFWRSFPPGLFAIPNQPVYFLLFYQAGTQYAFMVIAGSPTHRDALIEALAVAAITHP